MTSSKEVNKNNLSSLCLMHDFLVDIICLNKKLIIIVIKNNNYNYNNNSFYVRILKASMLLQDKNIQTCQRGNKILSSSVAQVLIFCIFF